MSALFHFTCAHRAPLIEADGYLLPHKQPVLGDVKLVWLTDLADPDRDGLGLTSTFIDCDRTEYRFQALSHIGVRPWITSQWRTTLDPQWLDDLESYGQPLRWFVSDMTVPAVLARYREARQR